MSIPVTRPTEHSMLNRLLRLSLVMASAVIVVSSARAQSAPTLERVLEGFANMPGLYARFTEEKQIALLAVPVRSRGELFFAPPGRLLRRVTEPTPGSALIDGDTLTFVSGDRRQEIPLDDNEVVGGFVGSFRHVLAGDRQALERTFHVGFTAGEGQRWTLTLRPRGEALQRFMTQLVLEGDAGEVRRMVMTERNGDTTTTTFDAINTSRRYSQAEQRSLFRL